MDSTVLGLYLFATFLGGLVSGLAGFALGLVVSGIWLHIITPLQAAILMVGYGIFTQGYRIWKLRHTLSRRKAAPFIIGSALGVPVGTMLLTHINPAYMRTRHRRQTRNRAATCERSLAAIRHRNAGRTAGVVSAGGVRGDHLRPAACSGEHRNVLLEALGGEFRRRLRAARLYGAAGGGDLRMDDRPGNSGWARAADLIERLRMLLALRRRQTHGQSQ
jgi:hypothetical protein